MLAPSGEVQGSAPRRITEFSRIRASGKRQPVAIAGCERSAHHVSCEATLLQFESNPLRAIAPRRPGSHINFYVAFIALEVPLSKFVEDSVHLGSVVSPRLQLAL